MDRTRAWRRGPLKAKYPDDVRNARAADKLEQLSGEVQNLTEEQFAKLAPYYSWSSTHWSDSVSDVCRQVGFRYVDNLDTFVERLVSVLQAVAA
jgi:hypothetical protein